MLKLKNKFKKIKWFKEYEEKVLKVHHDYYDKTLEQIFSFDSATYVYCTAIYDVVDNNKVNNLVKKLYTLKKSKDFSIEINYRKKGLKNLNYIRPEFDHTGHGIFAKVVFLNDSLISEVDMTWTQINNEEAIIEYKIKFKRSLNKFSQIHDFVIENYKQLKKVKYSEFYFNIEHFLNDDSQSIQTELKYFRTLLQQKLDKILSSSYSKKYLLPIKYTYLIDKKTEKIMKYIKDPFLEESFILDKEHYLVTRSIEKYEGIEITEIIFKKRFNPISITVLMSKFKMALYYRMFYEIEKQELEYKISKYLNSKKFLINFWDYKWLLNKKRRINEKRFYNINTNYAADIKGFSNKDLKLADNELIKNILDVYNDNIEYINNLNLINYNIIAFVISILALIISIIAIFQ